MNPFQTTGTPESPSCIQTYSQSNPLLNSEAYHSQQYGLVVKNMWFS